ncbi:MAG: hypothetical protein GY757_55355 [bacterium]|nr:hypothetical protein [bacterium]
MICLTGDVHHMGLKTRDQRYINGTELDSALKFLAIAENYGIKTTLFFTGKLFVEEKEGVKKLLKFKNLEIGGHNYYAFKPRLPFKIVNKLTGLKNGPYIFQNSEVKKTVETINRIIGIRIRSWRNHGYRNDRNTREILAKNGISYYSDEVTPAKANPYKEEGLTIIPVNVLPDHDYIYHGPQKKGYFDEGILKAGPFATGAMTVEQWLEVVKKQVEKIIETGGTATILAHPACMEIADNFLSFEKLCRFLGEYETVFMKEIRRLDLENV